ncbi:MAG: DUF6120 family protein [Eubacteriales bacterium]
MKNGENNNKIINLYLKEIKDKLLCPNNVKRAFLKEIRQNIADAEIDIVSIEDLYREIGSPEEIARSFESRDDIEKIKARAKKFHIIVAICAVISLLIISVLVYIIKEAKDDGNITVNISYNNINTESAAK